MEIFTENVSWKVLIYSSVLTLNPLNATRFFTLIYQIYNPVNFYKNNYYTINSLYKFYFKNRMSYSIVSASFSQCLLFYSCIIFINIIVDMYNVHYHVFYYYFLFFLRFKRSRQQNFINIQYMLIMLVKNEFVMYVYQVWHDMPNNETRCWWFLWQHLPQNV